MTHLRYKDYQGSVTYLDGTLLIQILHIDDLITTECEHAASAQKAFEELVDDYIQTCAELNKSPSKPFKGSFNVRVTPTLHRSVAMQAANRGESLNSFVQQALEEKVERAASHMRTLATMKYSRLFQYSHFAEWSHATLHEKSERKSPVIRSSAKSLYVGEAIRLRN